MSIYLGTNLVDYSGTNGGFGLNGRLLVKKTYSINLGQTNYSSLTLSTTGQNLTLPATTYTTTASTTVTCFRIGAAYDGTPINFNEHDYVGFHECVVNYNYGSNSVSGTIHPIRHCQTRDYQEGRYYGSINSTTGILNTSGTLSKNNSYITTANELLYQKADNSYALVSGGAYGIYHAGSGAVSWSTSNNYIDLKLGTVTAKTDSSYALEAALNAVNPANTTITMTWYVYECDRAMYGNIYSRAYELAANS